MTFSVSWRRAHRRPAEPPRTPAERQGQRACIIPYGKDDGGGMTGTRTATGRDQGPTAGREVEAGSQAGSSRS